jgi:hypothetical protein
MGYPAPTTSDWTPDDTPDTARFLMNTDDAKGVFLGSLLELRRHGYCWYVVDGEPREGGWPDATVAFVHRAGRPHLLLGSHGGLPHGEIGFGEWETPIEPRLRQTVVEMPEVDPDATGHAIYLGPDENGVSEGVGIETLGTVPAPPNGPPSTPLDGDAGSGACATTSYAARSPEKVIRQLFEGPFVSLLTRVRGNPDYGRKSFRRIGPDRWRIVADHAVLEAVVDEDGRCARLLALAPVDRDRPLRRLWLGERGATVRVDWGGGEDA